MTTVPAELTTPTVTVPGVVGSPSESVACHDKVVAVAAMIC
jgi:hypothetical protein